MGNNKIERLDQLEQCGPELSNAVSNEIIGLATDLSRDEGGLEVLIERYSASEAMIFPRTIAYLLARKADERDPEAGRLIIPFLEKMVPTDELETLTNTLTALQFLSSSDGPAPWHESPRPLPDFLLRCLRSSNPLQATGRKLALSVTYKLAILGWLTDALTVESVDALRKEIVELCSPIDATFPSHEIPELIEFLDTYKDTISESEGGEQK